jgi:nitroimidazol reductase NimA-like FMN-containing flavoprotein (pyridoxamine 5'-phosphate oxidase superfamily)
MPNDSPASYAVDEVNRVKRRHDRGFYDQATVHALLDSAALCHVSYVIDGQPYCTPTLYWRDGSRLYWHGSSASRMLRNLSTGEPACLTVTHLDSLVLARCGFNHSADYRSVMAFGRARLLSDPDEKERALVMMVDRLFPHRTATLRQSSTQEIKATAVITMEIERASAKIRAKGVADDDEDYELPIYAERLPVYTVLGAPEACPRLLPGVARPSSIEGYREGRRLEDALTEAYGVAYPEAGSKLG